MKFFVKSAGRQATQDYVWAPLDGAATGVEAKALSLAEQALPRRGRANASVTEFDDRKAVSALLFGNVGSGRSDFYGTPIFNSLGIVFDASDAADAERALAFAADWNSDPSAVERLLRSGVAADPASPSGFSVSGTFRDDLLKIASGAPAGRPRPDADVDLTKSIRAAARLAGRPVPPPTARSVDRPVPPSSVPKPETPMKIFVNTVPSGSLDYGWYVGGRPEYADRLWNVCEPVRSVTAATPADAFFAALAREPGKWVLFLQDVVGRDRNSNRPARFTFAIEISDADSRAREKARRLLGAWLHPVFLLPKIFAQFIDNSGEEVVADEAKLLAAAEDVAGSEKIPLDSLPLGPDRIWKHLSRDRSNFDELREEACQFVDDHEFPDAPGVHFLFTNAPYSCKPSSPDALPRMPARYVITGFREGEPDAVSQPEHGGRSVPDPVPVPGPGPGVNRRGRIALGAAVLCAIGVFAASVRGCGGGRSKAVSPEKPSGTLVTNGIPLP